MKKKPVTMADTRIVRAMAPAGAKKPRTNKEPSKVVAAVPTGSLQVWSANMIDCDRAKRAMVATMRDAAPLNSYARGYYAATVDMLHHSLWLLEEMRHQAGLPSHRQPEENIRSQP